MTTNAISSGQTAARLILSAGDALIVDRGGTSISAFIGSGAVAAVIGVESAGIVAGLEDVQDGGIAFATTRCGVRDLSG